MLGRVGARPIAQLDDRLPAAPKGPLRIPAAPGAVAPVDFGVKISVTSTAPLLPPAVGNKEAKE